MNYIIIISTLVFIAIAIIRSRGKIVSYLLRLRARLQIRSLREAIGQADENKAKTGRKSLVVFNKVSGKYEVVEKKLLKKASQVSKNKNNARMTEGRKRMARKGPRVFSSERVKQIQKKSLYVTD